MNLALLDPFRRQIPDRIDSTLTLPRSFHPKPCTILNNHNNRTSSSSSSVHASTTTTTKAKKGSTSKISSKSSTRSKRQKRNRRRRKSRSSMEDDNNSDDDDNDDNDDNDDDNSDDDMNDSDNGNTDHPNNNHRQHRNRQQQQQQQHLLANNEHENCCYTISFNRRGTYLAAGHKSGALAIHDFASRTLSSIVHPPCQPLVSDVNYGHGDNAGAIAGASDEFHNNLQEDEGKMDIQHKYEREDEDRIKKDDMYNSTDNNINISINININNSVNNNNNNNSEKSSAAITNVKTKKKKFSSLFQQQQQQQQHRLFPHGITSTTWSRRSRTCLMASIGDNHVCFIDNVHPFGPNDVSIKIADEEEDALITNTIAADATAADATTTNISSSNHLTNNYTTSVSGGDDVKNNLNFELENNDDDNDDDDDDDDDDNNRHQNQNRFQFQNAKNDYKMNLNSNGNCGNGGHENKESIFKRTRYITKLDIILSNKNEEEKETVATTDITTNSNDKGPFADFTQDNIGSMTQEEKDIAMKPSTERTMNERHLFVMMRMRFDKSANNDKSSMSNNSSVFDKNPMQKKEEIDQVTGSISDNGEMKESNHEKIMYDVFPPSAKKTKYQIKESHHYQKIVMSLPRPVQSSVEIHPNGLGGLACLDDGSLVIFGLSKDNTFCVDYNDDDDDDDNGASNKEGGKLLYLHNATCASSKSNGDDGIVKEKQLFVTCATFDPRGHYVYAATKCGSILWYQLSPSIQQKLFQIALVNQKLFATEEVFKDSLLMLKSKVPGGSSIHQIVCSRNGRMVVINSKDNTLRLYETRWIWDYACYKNKAKTMNFNQVKEFEPKFAFQDVVSRGTRWASCDLSGDGEYLVGGCNNAESGDKYELYLWNTVTGKIFDLKQ
jgi:hypothetical protein